MAADKTFEKQELRKIVRERFAGRHAAQLQAASEAVMAQIEALPQFVSADTVALYWSIGGEVGTRAFVERVSRVKTVLLPVVAADWLVLKKFSRTEEMQPGCFGIAEPQCEDFPVKDYDKIGLMVVPGVAFDKSGNRLGRGKGFYDRLLPLVKGCKVGVCFDFQLFDEIPADSHDVAMDMVISAGR